MKKIKSLVAAFSLATAGLLGVGAATPANAQTVPYNPQGVVYSQPGTTASAVSQTAIDDLSYNVGVQTPYYRAGRGFTQGVSQTGESVGLEFVLNGGQATVVSAYNLNDPNARNQFQIAVNNAAQTEQRLAYDEQVGRAPVVYTEYPAYEICAPVRPILGIGFVINGWFAGYVPHYNVWDGFFYEGGHNHNWRNDRNDWERRNPGHTTIIEHNTTIINGGGNRDHGFINGGERGGERNHTTIINNNTVVRPPVVDHSRDNHVVLPDQHRAQPLPVFHPPAVQENHNTPPARIETPRQVERQPVQRITQQNNTPPQRQQGGGGGGGGGGGQQRQPGGRHH